MNRREKIRNEIDKTLGLLDQKETLIPNPYFYTRIQQRIKEESEKGFFYSNLLKPAFFTVLVALNLTTAIWYITSNNVTTYTESNLELADVLKNDFNLENDQIQSLLFK